MKFQIKLNSSKISFILVMLLLGQNYVWTAEKTIKNNYEQLVNQPPGIPIDNELFKKGFLDVTLLGADSTGTRISTTEIQTAVNLAYENDLVCFFPSGTYLVDDIIKCKRRSEWIPNNWRESPHQLMMVGSSLGKRPLIKLVGNKLNDIGTAVFGSSSAPKPVFWIWAQAAYKQQPECGGTVQNEPPSDDPECEQSNVNYHHLFKGIDIDLGGKPGAVGIRMAGAQGATIEDVKINAIGAFAGLYNIPGQGGGTYNVEVEGGKYAFYISKVGTRDQSKFQVMSGCVFKNQTEKVFRIDSKFPFLIVGFHIVANNLTALNLGLPGDGLSLIDGVIEMQGGKLIEGNTSSLYMKNVSVKGVSTIANSLTVNPNVWTRIEEYSYCDNLSTNLIDGVLNKAVIKDIIEDVQVNPQILVDEIISKHVWSERAFPHIQMQNFVNVKDPAQMNGFPAIGNGTTDDTEALRYAIEHYDNVFLPKGNYLVSKTLFLQKNTKIFGAGRTYSIINLSANWNSVDGEAVIETVDDSDATTMLAFIGINTFKTHPPSDYYNPQHPIIWKAGSKSMVRSVSPGVNIYIKGNGGGRWYAIYNHIHQFFVDGTTQQLSIYGFNPERAANPQCEIKNASNINLYYVKTETHTTTDIFPQNTYSVAVKMINSSNIHIFGSTGNFELTDQMGMFEIENCNNISINHVRPFLNATNWFTIKETAKGEVFNSASATRLALYKSKNVQTTNELPKLKSINAFPNPFKHSFEIICPNVDAKTLEIYNCNGILVSSQSIDSLNNIHVSEMWSQAPGLYFAKFNGNNYNQVFRLIKNN